MIEVNGWRMGVWVRVLGAAAGGGFPQWNCGCPQCRAVRDGSRPCRSRTQSSVAVSADYRRWFLLNASPDIRAQIEVLPGPAPTRDQGFSAAGRAAHRRGAGSHPRLAACCERLTTSRYTPPRRFTRHSSKAHRCSRRSAPTPASSGGRSSTGTEVSLADGLSYRAFDVPTNKRARFGTGEGKRAW